MAILRKLISSILFFSMVCSFVSCGKLIDEIMGTGDDEPIQCNYSVALKGKWKVVRAGYVENPAGEMAYVNKEETIPTSLEWIEFGDGTAHFHFSQPVMLEYQTLGMEREPDWITDYICLCKLDNSGFCNFSFGFSPNEYDGGYHESYCEWDFGEENPVYRWANLWAYGKDDDYATTLILYGTNDTYRGYEMKRYDK